MNRTTYALALLAVMAAALIAGCGSSGSSSETTGSPSGATETSASSSASGSGMALTSATVSGLGTVLVDSEGFTVYEFSKDTGTASACNGACAEAWPPVLTKGAPVAGEGAMSSQLGTTKRKDGTTQVTYASRPPPRGGGWISWSGASPATR